MKRLFFATVLLVGCGSKNTNAVDAAIVDAASSTADASPTKIITEIKNVTSQGFAEGTFIAKKGELIVVKLTSAAAFDWNIHGHNGGTTQVVKGERDVMTTRYEFSPSSDGEWFLIFSNKNPAAMDVQVRLEIYGTTAFSWN
jgi:hypothetical protein